MIPKTLRFKAFESYVEEQLVDFSVLSENGLFLINGETGAGKTAVLDAMTYALYGETSGGTRGDVRSLHALAEGIPTEVEFVFELSQKIYKFTRTIKIRERAEKTNVYTEQNAMFFDGESFVPFESNPTKTKVAAKAMELLGLSLDQFRQVIILPQGEFEKFLISESGEKEKILSTLFNADKFTKISDILYSKAKHKISKLNVEKEIISSLLTNEGFAGFEELSLFIEKITEGNKQLKLKLETMVRKLEEEKNVVKNAETVSKLFLEKDTANSEILILEKKSGEIFIKSQKLKKAQIAMKISGIYNDYLKVTEALKERKENQSFAKKEEEKISEQNGIIKTELENLKKSEKQNEQKMQRIIILEQLLPVYKEISKAQNEFLVAEKEYNLVQKAAEKNRSDEMEFTEKINDYTKKSGKLFTEYVQKIPLLTSKKAEITAALSKKGILNQLEADVITLEKDLSAKNIELEKLNIQADEKKRKFDEAYNLQLENLTVIIAKSLKDGMPCPVCGSIEHPKINSFERAQSENNTKKLKSELDELQERKNKLCQEINALQSKIDTKKISVDTVSTEIPNGDYNKEDLEKITSDLQLAQKAQEKVELINNEVARLKKNLDEILLQKISFEKKIYEFQSDAISKKSHYESLKASILLDIPDMTALEKEISNTRNFIEKYKFQFENLTKKHTELGISLSVAQTALKQANEEFLKTENDFIKAEKLFNESLEKNGYKNVFDFTESIMTDNEISEIQNQILDFQNKKYALEEKLKELSLKLNNLEKPCMEQLYKTFSEHEEEYRKNSDELAVAQNEEKRLVKILQDYKQRNEKYLVEMEKAVKYEEFAKLLQGSRGTSFTRYVLGVMLSLITSEANRLLLDVHGGRFQIYRKTDGTEKNRKTGLDLEVQSAMAVSKFSVKNLSGGEKFLISLALSMALSSVLQSQSGGISIDAMFIDEGFGSLDRQSLNEAMGILSHIKDSRRTIGIISHVDELKEIIQSRIDVEKNESGSHIKIVL